MSRMSAGTSLDADGSRSRSDADALLLVQLGFEQLLADLSEGLADIASGDFLSKSERTLSQLVAVLGYDRCTFAELVAGDHLNVLCSVAADGLRPKSAILEATVLLIPTG